ncbi:MAG: 3-isopropylmalate dehydratase small subunit [Crenarchaeota archaeon]|nr:MAG: 3-isopropylmalate dehydratase small subunit [Thermoproteota archaeon]RDJ33681.1 MAG: 3-isopropylmalate dehydratase small subunit [Thermoproteota archaeon]RDJ37259.1 MAG: 3-isopropylmalate dehydratase small subunit [Thermoproteota archaeon]RDJ39213.1 MAG: 3-isopropylmalate dehydratase small subunit [Thermoproteota archaeon]
MKPFEKISSIVTPLDKVNVDTDQIIPKQFLKLVQKSGFGKYVFYNWRFSQDEKPIDTFVLNEKKYQGSKILVTGDNFGCGSSREHAVWALQDFGFSVIIAPSFADIFYSNCFKNGILPIQLEQKIVEKLMNETSPIQVDLQNQLITTNSQKISFDIDSYKKKILLEGLDDIALTLQYEDKISEYEKNSRLSSVL